MLSDFQIRSMCFTFNSGAVEPVSASMPFLSFCLWHDDDESVTTVPTHIREKRVLVVSEGMHCTCHFNCLVLSSLLKLPPRPNPATLEPPPFGSNNGTMKTSTKAKAKARQKTVMKKL